MGPLVLNVTFAIGCSAQGTDNCILTGFGTYCDYLEEGHYMMNT